MKANKAPGPDEAPAELLKRLDINREEELLAFFNEVWDQGTILQEWNHAMVVTCGNDLQKKGNECRHISVLNSMYSSFAPII